jgi:hypothetical protein
MFYNARWYDPALGRFAQADTVVPNGAQGLDRYAYTFNSPLRYTDSSGHDPFLDFVAGMLAEVEKSSLWFMPKAQQDLSIRSGETDAMLAGRLVGGIISIGIGIAEFAGGVGAAGGGVVACGTGVGCVVSPAAVTAGSALIAQGTATSLSAAAGVGQTLSAIMKRSGSEGESGSSEAGGTQSGKSPYGFPENNGTPPIDGWEWHGNGDPGSSEGSWVNPDSPKENLHWDPSHHTNVSASGHWDYRDANGVEYWIWPDGTMTPK